jgi:hypothetical protein
MATNYFEMMRDTVGSYGEGVDLARTRQYQDEVRQRQAAEFAQRQRDWARQNRMADTEDAAVGDLESLSRGSVQQGTGLSVPSGQMLYQQGYGGQQGADAVRAAAGDMDREQARMGLQRTAQPTADVSTRAATPLEMNSAAMRVALARRDMATYQALAEKGRTLAEDEAISKAMKQPVDDSLMQWVNSNHKQLSIGTPDKNGIAAFSVVTPDGKAMFGRLNRADLAKLQGAAAIMDMNPTRAWEMVAGVNKDLAAALNVDNSLALNAGKANNEGAYQSGQVTNSRITANASASNAATLREYHGLQGKLLQREMDNNDEARKLAEQFDALTPQDQAGAKGQALVRRFNILNAKPGSMMSGAGGAGAGKLPATLTDQEKVAYGEAVKEIALIPGKDRTPMRLAQVYQSYGLDPSRFGVAGLPSWGAPAPTLGSRDTPAAVAPEGAGLDADGIPVPRGGLRVNPGYGVPDARGLLRTPSYSANPNRFNPD